LSPHNSGLFCVSTSGNSQMPHGPRCTFWRIVDPDLARLQLCEQLQVGKTRLVPMKQEFSPGDLRFPIDRPSHRYTQACPSHRCTNGPPWG